MARFGLLILIGMLAAALLSGCGGGAGGGGSMMLKITSPTVGTTCSGNQTITATMLNPAMATKVNFKINGQIFATVDPALTMSVRLDTLSWCPTNGAPTITVQSTGNVYTASETINVNNGKSLYVEDVAGDGGSVVHLHVKLNTFAGAGGYHVILKYDHNKLQLTPSTVAKGTGVPVASSFVKDTSVAGTLDVTVSGTDAFTSGDLLVADFLIKGPSASGTRNDVTVDTATLSDTSGAPITVNGWAGYVTTN